MDCSVKWSQEAGDHIVVVGSIVDAGIVSDGDTLQEARSMYTKRSSS
jgi:flavin reductase (DIM6/NTAB) family NADH-FMN oxidoreductase RutF